MKIEKNQKGTSSNPAPMSSLMKIMSPKTPPPLTRPRWLMIRTNRTRVMIGHSRLDRLAPSQPGKPWQTEKRGAQEVGG
ncbi:hypothetical protein VTH06DRAFT_2223 [Thermothelomyces fergusii]